LALTFESGRGDVVKDDRGGMDATASLLFSGKLFQSDREILIASS
jgi:hypothetical protein